MNDKQTSYGRHHIARNSTESATFMVDAPWPLEDHWVAEEGFFWLPNEGILLLVHDNVTQQMREDLAGPVDIHLLAHGPLIGLLCRFGGGWEFQEAVLASRGGDLPEHLVGGPDAPQRLLFHAILVDHGTKQIAHMRAFSVSPHFTTMLRREVASRWVEGATPVEYDAAQEEWYRRWPTIPDVKKAALARSHGGD